MTARQEAARQEAARQEAARQVAARHVAARQVAARQVAARQGRAAGALYGLAVGDALGMPTESLARPEIVTRYGPLLEDLQPGATDQPLAPGLPAGTVTDDTEQALLLADLIIEGDGAVDEAEFAGRLLAWEGDMRARGSLSLLGPSTKRALSALLAGTPLARGRPQRHHQRRGHADHARSA